jgi:hypothetical protein
VHKNLYFRNAAHFPAELLRVDESGTESSNGFMSPGTRRAVLAFNKDVWRARAVRPGHAGDGRLMAEHVVGAVVLKSCDCPQPAFVDCAKPPFKGPRGPSDPVVFENRAMQPLDLYFWNGTCEELISWDTIGGVQPGLQKPIQSTQGHTFRARGAASGQMLMQYTLNDVVLRACEEDEASARATRAGQLHVVVARLERERDVLRESLAFDLARLTAVLRAGLGNMTAQAALPAEPAVRSGAAVKTVPVSALGGLLLPLKW